MIHPSPELCAKVRELLSHTVSSKDLSWHSMSPNVTFLLYIERDYPGEFFSLCTWFTYQHRYELWNTNVATIFYEYSFYPWFQCPASHPYQDPPSHKYKRKAVFLFLLQEFYFYYSIRVITLCDICIHLHLCADQVCCLLESWMFVNRAQGGRMLWFP